MKKMHILNFIFHCLLQFFITDISDFSHRILLLQSQYKCFESGNHLFDMPFTGISGITGLMLYIETHLET